MDIHWIIIDFLTHKGLFGGKLWTWQKPSMTTIEKKNSVGLQGTILTHMNK